MHLICQIVHLYLCNLQYINNSKSEYFLKYDGLQVDCLYMVFLLQGPLLLIKVNWQMLITKIQTKYEYNLVWGSDIPKDLRQNSDLYNSPITIRREILDFSSGQENSEFWWVPSDKEIEMTVWRDKDN